MATLEKESFLRITDKMAFLYREFRETLAALQVEAKASGVYHSPKKATLLFEPTPSVDPEFLIEATEAGTAGNSIILKLIDPVANDSPLTLAVVGDVIRIYLETDGSGDLATTSEDIFNLLKDNELTKSILNLTDINKTTDIVVEADTHQLSGGDDDSTFQIFSKKNSSRYNGKVFNFLNSGSSLSLAIEETNQGFDITLETDGSGDILTVASDIKTLIEADINASPFYSVSLVGDGSGLVSAGELILTGGTENGMTPVPLETPLNSVEGCGADGDVVETVPIAKLYDSGLNTTNLVQGVGVIENWDAELENHIARTGGSGIATYLLTQGIRVHEYYAIINARRTGNPLTGPYVFKDTAHLVGDWTVNSNGDGIRNLGSALGVGSGAYSTTNYAAQKLVARYYPPFTTATKLFEQTDPEGNFTLTAKNPGSEGNLLTFTLNEIPLNNATTDITVTGDAVQINLATDGTGSITTATSLKASIEADAILSALVEISLTGDGSGIVEANAATPLEDGLGPYSETDVVFKLTGKNPTYNDQEIAELKIPSGVFYGDIISLSRRAFKLTPANNESANSQVILWSQAIGSGGNQITIEFLDPAAASQAASVTVVDNAITINLATDGSEEITTTAAQIATLIQGSVPALALVYVKQVGDGTGIVVPFGPSNLLGGDDGDRYYDITAVEVSEGDAEGSRLTFTSVPERAPIA